MRLAIKPRYGIFLSRGKITGTEPGWTPIAGNLVLPAPLVEDAPVIIGSVPPGVQCPAVGLGYILHERQYLYKPCWVFITVVRRGNAFVHTLEIVHCQGDLFEVVGALNSTGRFTRRLNRRQQQGDENANDGDHDQKFDQRKCRSRQPLFRQATAKGRAR